MIIQPARKLERGQALPLLALALVALAGFTALALDGGNLYTEQRRAQAAADNAVMAAAYQAMRGATGDSTQANFDCANIRVNDPAQAAAVPLAIAACQNATQNGYVSSDSHTTVVFHLPPVHGAYAGNSQYMEVVITQTVATALAHLVYRQDPIPLTVIAVAHGSPTGPVMAGYAIAAMFPTCTSQNGTIYLQARGGGQYGGTFLTDGGAFVNSPCTNPVALDASGNHDGIVTNGPPISVVGGANGTACLSQNDPDPSCNWYPAPTTGVPGVSQDPLAGSPADIAPPCGPSLTMNGQMQQGAYDLQPGSYTSLDAGSKDMKLEPGIYCLSGGLLATNNQSITGIGVMIYLVDTAAQINFAGSGSLDLEAPTKATSGCTGYTDTGHNGICPYLGIVIYKVTGANQCIDNSQNTDITFSGSASMSVVGLVYAPYSFVKYGGGGNLTMTGQTMAGCVKFNGNGNINIIYNPDDTYSPPPSERLDQ